MYVCMYVCVYVYVCMYLQLLIFNALNDLFLQKFPFQVFKYTYVFIYVCMEVCMVLMGTKYFWMQRLKVRMRVCISWQPYACMY